MPCSPCSPARWSATRDSWRWRDSVAEPRVRDQSPEEWNFRCRSDTAGSTLGEVLRGVAAETPALARVLDAIEPAA